MRDDTAAAKRRARRHYDRTEEQRQAANVRERRRMREIYRAFERLRSVLPLGSSSSRCIRRQPTRLELLRMAVERIRHLEFSLCSSEQPLDLRQNSFLAFNLQPPKMPVDIETISPGDGTTFPKNGQTVSCHYTLTLENGKQIDSSRDRGKPLDFVLGAGQVIKGWEQGVAKLSLGQRAKMTISPDLGYGPEGIPGTIPRNSVLIFDVELVKIK